MPPTDAATKVKDPEYSNWLKVGLALYYLKDGLHSFIQGEVDAMHQFLLQMLYHSSVVPKPKCSSCHSKDVKQNRNTHVWKFRSPCPSNLCDVWLKELMTVHTNPTSNKIYWENCDVTAWPFVPWECAKLYMPRGQPPTNIGPSYSDAQALLTLMTSCTYFHGKLSTAGLTLTHTVSKIRNCVMHSGEMKLSDGDRKSFIQDIIHLLEDPTHLISLKECKEAVAEINRINDDSLDVFLNFDLEMKALRECINDCRQELGIHRKDTEVTVESLKDEFTKLQGQFVTFAKETKDKLGDLDAKCQRIDTSVTILSKTVSSDREIVNQELSRLDKEIQEVKASSSEALKAADRVSAENMESDICKFRDDLIKAYRNLRCVQVSPIYEKMRCNIDNIYVDLVIAKKQDSRNAERENRNTEEESNHVSTQCQDALSSSSKVIKVTSYKQIFQDERGSNFKRVYLRGKGGLGKTTFCRKVLHAWCNAHEERAVAHDGSFQDEDILKMFDLLFYINLREVSIEEKTLIAVICAQFPLEEVPSQNFLETQLKCNGDKVLFILDGLDELVVKAGFIDNVVTRRVYPNCCFLVSSRPYKIFQMELHVETEIDLLMDLKGFSKKNAIKCARKIFENCYKDGNVIKQFEMDLACNMLAKHLIHIPLLLLFLAQVWYENNRSLPSKHHELYILFLNLMADRMKEKCKKDPNHRQTRFTQDDTPSPLPSKISKTSLVVDLGEGFLHSLCEVAHHFLLSSENENSLVFEEKQLMKVFGDRAKEKLDVALDLGILSITYSLSFLNRKACVSFLHKSVQEFFTAVCFILSPVKLSNFISSITDLSEVEQNENVVVFLVGLKPELGNRVLEKVNEFYRGKWEVLTQSEKEDRGALHDILGASSDLEFGVYNMFSDISKFYLRCKEEVTGEDVLLNVSCLCLKHEILDLQCWNPAFLQILDLMMIQFPDNRADLRGLTGLTFLALFYINCELYLPESCSLSVLIVEYVTLSSSCCDVLGRTLTHCAKLRELKIHNADLHNCLLDLSNMIELTFLDMSRVTLSSSCCDVLGSTLTHCTKLRELKIHNTDLHNCLLDLSNMTELTFLNMSGVTLSSSCCDALGSTLTHCTKLWKLEIQNTDLHNCLLDLSNMFELTFLDMSRVTLSSSCCDVFGSTLTHCTKLRKLKIHNTDLHNCLLDLSNMTELTFLDMSGVTLSSSCCDALGSTLTHCTKLGELMIHNTDLHNCLLDLSNMTKLTFLDMSGVTLSSSCCDALGSTLTHCTKLGELMIHNTDLHNCLLDLSNMTELTFLDMSRVTLSSSCCDVFGSTLTHCTKLWKLKIHNTDLHNCLLDLSNMTELTFLNMSGVTLSSSCCDALGSTLTHCTKLWKLEIQNTDLHNCLLDFSNMTELRFLDISEVTLSRSCCDVLGSTIMHCTELIQVCILNTDLHNCMLDLSNMTRLLTLKLDVILSSNAFQILLLSFDKLKAVKSFFNDKLVSVKLPYDNDKLKVMLICSDAPGIDMISVL